MHCHNGNLMSGNLSRQVLPPCPCPSHTTPQLPTQEANRLASPNSLNTLLSSSCRRSAPTNFSDPLFPSEIFPYFLHDVTRYDFNIKCPPQAHVWHAKSPASDTTETLEEVRPGWEKVTMGMPYGDTCFPIVLGLLARPAPLCLLP